MSDQQAQGGDDGNYGYTPSQSWCIAFVTIFSVIAAAHSVQAFRSRYWVVYPTLVLGALIEITGWSARLWSSKNVGNVQPFLMQITTLIMAPVFFSAFDYIMLGVAIQKLGPKYSVLRPSWYFIVFLTADVISLILQAVGGGQAASTAETSAPTDTATDIMVAGIIFQLIAMVAFVGLGFDFIIRATMKRSYKFRERQIEQQREKLAAKQQRRDSEKSTATMVNSSHSIQPTDSDATDPKAEVGEVVESRENLNRWWLMLAGCLISSIAIVIRGVFRSIELSDGWDGPIATNELLTNGLDGIPMLIAVGIFNIINPVWVLPRRATWRGYH